MADVYVHASSGNDGNDGLSPGFPKRTLSAWAAVLNANPNNSTGHIAGVFRGETFTLTNLNNSTLRQWSGMATAEIRGDVVVTGTWVLVGSIWELTTGSFEFNSIRFFEDYDTNIDANGSNLGCIDPTNIASVLLDENQINPYFQSDTTLYLRMYNEENPNSHVITGMLGSLGGPKLVNPVNVTITGLRIWNFSRTTDFEPESSPQGCAILLDTPNGVTITNCDFKYGGDSMVFIWSLAGNAANVTIDNCAFRGGSQQSAHVMVHMPAGNATGIRVRNSTFNCHTWLDRFGDFTPAVLGGAFAHSRGIWTNLGAANTVDIEVTNCVFLGYDWSSLCRCDNENGDVSTANQLSWASYPIRFSDCTATGFKAIYRLALGKIFTGSIAFRRCLLESLNQRGTNGGVSVDDDPYGETINSAYKTLLESSVLISDTGTAVDLNTTLVLIGGTGRLICLNSTIYDDSATAGGAGTKPLIRWATGGAVRLLSRQSLFAMRSANALAVTSGGVVTASDFDMLGNWFRGHSTTAMTDSTLLDTQAEFAAAVDQVANGAIYGTDPQFILPPSNLEGIPGGNLRTITRIIAGAAATGVNGNPYDGHYGAYQYGGGGGGGAPTGAGSLPGGDIATAFVDQYHDTRGLARK